MSNISVTLNLTKLQSAKMRIKNKKGDLVECVVIPIVSNRLIVGKEGGVYLNLVAFELKDKKPDRKDTHIVKQSIPKDELAKLTDDEKNALPLLGNITVWGSETQTNSFEAETPTNNNNDDTLPF